ncbi:MAG: DUF1622 domain-containing protein [Coriobacteriia bacterium]
MPEYTQFIDVIAAGFGVIGVVIILVGFFASVAQAVRIWPHEGADVAYLSIRSTFGKSILLGLEVMVAGDIILTVTLQPTLGNLAVLGLLVAIRTFLAWSLEVELDGRWPWTRAQAELPH